MKKLETMFVEKQLNLKQECVLQEPVQPLHYSEHAPITSPFQNLYRFGIQSGPSSFFEAVYSWQKDFREMDNAQRQEYIKEKRHLFLESISDDDLMQEQSFFVQFVEIYKMILLILQRKDNSFSFFQSEKDFLDIIFQLIPMDVIQADIITLFESTIMQMETTTYGDYIQTFRSLYQKYMNQRIDEMEKNVEKKWSDDLRGQILDILLQTVDHITSHVLDEVLSEYKANIENVDCNLSLNQCLWLMDEYEINIFVLDAARGMPSDTCIPTGWDPSHHCIVLLHYPDHHYEVLGRVYDKKVSRLFPFEDKMIQMLINYYE